MANPNLINWGFSNNCQLKNIPAVPLGFSASAARGIIFLGAASIFLQESPVGNTKNLNNKKQKIIFNPWHVCVRIS